MLAPKALFDFLKLKVGHLEVICCVRRSVASLGIDTRTGACHSPDKQLRMQVISIVAVSDGRIFAPLTAFPHPQ